MKKQMMAEFEKECKAAALRLRNAAIAAVKKFERIPGWNRVSIRETSRHRDTTTVLVQTLKGGEFRVFEYSPGLPSPRERGLLPSACEILPDGSRDHGLAVDRENELYKAYKRSGMQILEVILNQKPKERPQESASTKADRGPARKGSQK